MNVLTSTYRQTFPGRHTVLPVIHVDSLEQALRNAQIARAAGADGVFLINHGMPDDELLDIHRAVAETQTGWWVGVNPIGMSPAEVFGAVSRLVSGVWVDNAGIEESREQQLYAESVLAIRDSRVPECLYFGGVAFKYQRPVEELEAACRAAARYMDVVTTSGPGTGHAAEVEKIRRMKLALGDAPLAIASGITPENVADYLPYADCFLVATGISHGFTELDPLRVRALVERVRAFDESVGAVVQMDTSKFPDHLKGYDQTYEYDKRFGRLTNNFCLDVFAHGRECLEWAISIAFTPRQRWEAPRMAATHYLVDPEYGLVFFQKGPRDWSAYGLNVSQSLELEIPLDIPEITELAWNWLEKVEYPDTHENDGGVIKGWRVYNEEEGVVGGCSESVVAIKPFWVYLGK